MTKVMCRFLLSAVLISSLFLTGFTSASSSPQNFMIDSSWLSKAVAEEVPVALVGVVMSDVALEKNNFIVYVDPRDEIRICVKYYSGDKWQYFTSQKREGTLS